MTARVAMLLKSRASVTCFRVCFLPDRAKDLSAPPYITLLVLATVGYIQGVYFIRGTRWRSWSRHCGTNRKVAVSISRGGPGVDSASDRNEYQEYFLGGKGGRCVGLITLSSKSGSLNLLEPSRPVQACTEIAYTQEVSKDPTLLTALKIYVIIIIIIIIICHGVGPLVDPFRSHVSRSLLKGLP